MIIRHQPGENKEGKTSLGRPIPSLTENRSAMKFRGSFHIIQSQVRKGLASRRLAMECGRASWTFSVIVPSPPPPPLRPPPLTMMMMMISLPVVVVMMPPPPSPPTPPPKLKKCINSGLPAALSIHINISRYLRFTLFLGIPHSR